MVENAEPDDCLVEIENAIDQLHRAQENALDHERLERAQRELRNTIDGDEAEDYGRQTDWAD